ETGAAIAALRALESQSIFVPRFGAHDPYDTMHSWREQCAHEPRCELSLSRRVLMRSRCVACHRQNQRAQYSTLLPSPGRGNSMLGACAVVASQWSARTRPPMGPAASDFTASIFRLLRRLIPDGGNFSFPGAWCRRHRPVRRTQHAHGAAEGLASV